MYTRDGLIRIWVLLNSSVSHAEASMESFPCAAATSPPTLCGSQLPHSHGPSDATAQRLLIAVGESLTTSRWCPVCALSLVMPSVCPVPGASV